MKNGRYTATAIALLEVKDGDEMEGEPQKEDQAEDASHHHLGPYGFPDVVDEGWCRALAGDGTKGYDSSFIERAPFCVLPS